MGAYCTVVSPDSATVTRGEGTKKDAFTPGRCRSQEQKFVQAATFDLREFPFSFPTAKRQCAGDHWPTPPLPRITQTAVVLWLDNASRRARGTEPRCVLRCRSGNAGLAGRREPPRRLGAGQFSDPRVGNADLLDPIFLTGLFIGLSLEASIAT